MTGTKRPILCLGSIDWDFLFHRPQQLMLHLARMGHPVHYRNPTQIRSAVPHKVAENLWVYKDFDMLPKNLLEISIYFVYFPAHASWIDPGLEKFVVYDCLDDFPGLSDHEELMLTRADLVLCCSRELMAKHQDKHPQMKLLPNGVDCKHYQADKHPIPPEMRLIRSAGRSVIGFTGAFHTEWVDAEMLYNLADSKCCWQFVVIGENYHWDFDNGSRITPPNLFYLGMLPYDVLPSYVRFFDIGIIPFLDNQIARAADPVKLYEYLAAGLPVVSRSLPFTDRLGAPYVYTYTTACECPQAIERALADDKRYRNEARQLRMDFAANCSWENRVAELCAKLRELTWLEK